FEELEIMPQLKKILVGVDLLQSRQGELSPPVAEAVKQALWLAKKLSGEIMYLSTIELPREDELFTPLEDHQQIVREVEAAALEALQKLVEQAKGRGVRANRKLAYGTGWIELTREATNGKYDLVVVGTRNLGAVRRTLFGSTAMKLLHHCPSPVWVAKPDPHPTPTNLLVASDFSAASDAALRWALRIGASSGAKLHLIHVLEHPYARLRDASLVEARHEELYREQSRAAAEERLKEQLVRISGAAGCNAEVCVAEGPYFADDAILRYIEAHQIDLLVMGTRGRTGIAGFLIGNTAERLVTAVGCSLLAVR
ncbi:MAG: universal stress protein, partial [Pirellulales bacterium]